MKRTVLLILLTSLAAGTKAQLTLQWAKRAGSTGYDVARSMTIDAAGNVYTTGLFTGTLDFDPGSGTFTMTSSSSDDIYISKFDASGNFVWAKQFTGDFGSTYDICTDASGNVLTTGVFSNYMDFDPGTATVGLTAGGDDMFISKLDANGNFVWVKRIGASSGTTMGRSIACDASGAVFTTGELSNYNTDFDPGSGTYYLGVLGVRDAFVCKLDAGGNFSWATSFMGTSNDQGTGIAIDPAGDVIATGHFCNTVDFDPSSSTYTLISASVSVEDVYVCKLTNSGSFVWAKKIGSTNVDFSYAVTTDALGSVYSTGIFSGVVDFDPGAGTYTLNGGNSYSHTFFLKLNSGGNFVWAKSLGNSFWVAPHSIAVDGNNNFYANGWFNVDTDFDPGSGSYTLSPTNGGTFLLKLDSTSSFLWAKQTGAQVHSSWSYGKSLAVDANTYVHMAGYFTNTVDLDLTSSTSNLSSAGSEDIFVAKYCQVPDQPSGIAGGPFGCNGGSMIFSVTPALGATSYSWSLPTGLSGSSTSNSINAVAGSSGGTVSIYAMNACGSSPSRTLAVSISPSLSISANNATICSPGSASLLASGANSYSWSTGATSNSIVTSQSATTVYTVTGFAGGCADAVNTATVSLAPVSLTLSATSLTVCAGQTTTLTASGASTYSWNFGATSASIILTGSASASANYTVRGNNGPCTDTKTINITSYANPVVSGNSVSICQGTSYTMNPSGAFTYTYSNGSASVSPSTNTTYSVMGTNAQGCISQFPGLFQLQVLSLPVISVNSGTVCSGQVFTMNPTGATSYTYSNGASTVVPTSNATYSITGSDAQGCVSATAAIASVSVLPLPIVTINSGSICAGEIFTLVPTGALTYSYSSISNTVSPLSTNSFSVIGADALGCVSLPATTTITVHALPIVSVNSGTICTGEIFTMAPTGAASYTYSSGSPTISPLLNTTYSVTGTSAQGCISPSPAISNVMVNSLPVVFVNSGAICAGETFIMVPYGAINYTFSNGSATVIPSASNAYSVTGTNLVGCVSLPAVSNVTVNPLPNVNLSTSSPTICTGESATLTVSGAISYSWSAGGNDTSMIISPTVSTQYAVTGSDANGCVGSNSISQVVDVCLGISQSNDHGLTIYPNPSSGELNIESEMTLEITVTNSLGEIVLVSTLHPGSSRLNLHEQANGLYILTVTKNQDSSTHKIIKH